MTNQAVEKVKQQVQTSKPAMSIESLIRDSAKQLGDALPAHMRPERIVRIALTTLRLNPKLYKCDPYSFLGALFQSAQLGLEPNIEGESYIIPYNVSFKAPDGSWGKKLVAQFQIGYKGYVKLFWNHQNSVSLQMETVHENDLFEYDLGENKIHHVPPALGQERGAPIGYYAIGRMSGGGMAIKVMSKREAEEFGKRFSKCYDRKEGKFYPDTPWAEHFDAMAKKTVLRQLMKLLPKSIEIQHAIAMDETVKTRISADMVEIPDEDDHSKEIDAEPIVEQKQDQPKAQQEEALVNKDQLFGKD